MFSNHNNKSCIACMIQNIRLWKVDVLLHKQKKTSCFACPEHRWY